jgi:hypothetical protein
MEGHRMVDPARAQPGGGAAQLSRGRVLRLAHGMHRDRELRDGIAQARHAGRGVERHLVVHPAHAPPRPGRSSLFGVSCPSPRACTAVGTATGGALIGSRADERQATLQMKVTAFQGKVLSATAAVAFLVAIAVNAKPLWPFILFVAVSGVSGMVGWGIYHDDSAGEATGPDPAHFTAEQPPHSGMPLTRDSN